MEIYYSKLEMFGLILIFGNVISQFGICATECNFYSVGPSCNFKNIAYRKQSRHDSNKYPPHYSDEANDNSSSTCSYTSDRNTNTAAPWWNLWIPENTTFKKMEFVTKTDHLRDFQNFEVLVFNTTLDNFKTKGPLTDGITCYKHNASIPEETKIEVTCDGFPYGNLIRIQLQNKTFQLVICDFRLYEDCKDGFYGNGCEKCNENCFRSGYRNCRFNDGVCLYGCNSGWTGHNCDRENIAFGKQSRHDSNTNPPHYSYEANDNSSSTCSYTSDSNTAAPWWNLWMQEKTTFKKLEFVTKKESLWNFKNFEVLVYNTTWDNVERKGSLTDGLTCYKHNASIPEETKIEVTCDGFPYGNLIRIQLDSKQFQLVLCDFRIYGECKSGKWGKKCGTECGMCDDSSSCNRLTGDCPQGCSAGYKPPKCSEECERGKWGKDCKEPCGHCDNSTCGHVDGACLKGCSPGYKGQKCTDACESGKWGKHCKEPCGHCDISTCSHIDGHCPSGCSAGYKGQQCTQECESGKWGKDCKETCGHCDNSTCRHVDGVCPKGCSPGYKGHRCTDECDDGSYGYRCAGNCSKHCKDVCHKKTGKCSKCKAGWKGNNCSEECKDGTYGEACVRNCSQACIGVCNKVNGTCDQCQAGWTGDFCETVVSLSPSHSSDASSAVSGIVAALAAIIAIVLVAIGSYIFQRKKQKNGRNHEANKLSDLNKDNKDVTSNDHKEEPSSSTLYVNVSAIKKARETRAKYLDRTYVNNYANESANEQMYSNSKVTNEVHLLEFEAYVKSGLLNTEIFLKQFQKLPYGMQYASDVATKPVNNSKNRYKLMYAYDHSRVILRTLPDVPCSDYINASNIMGESGKVAYIAAQGPITNTLGDFWRMIWEQNVRTIVMLTNMTEEGKMKCLKYWLDVGETVQHDNTTVVSELEDVFAEYTIRRLKAYQKNKPDRTRTLAHFHYTAWPDKDVPRSTSSLLHFWQQVRRHDWKKTRPWLVHCSAGVGRTGTYIAMDDLYDKGINGASIDVFKCVDDLRRQRVNMVQTKGQYKYLHCIVLEALVLPSKPVQVDDFHSVYNDLKKTDPSTGKTSLLMHYETLVNGKTVTINDKDDERYAVAMRDENKHKNRYEDILAPSDCRPFLLTKVPGCTDYINAVLIPGYRDHLGYIITQTPLQSTAVDSCRLIYEQDVQVVVTFKEREEKDVGLYLSYDETAKFGPFNVKFIAEEERACYTRRNYLLVFKSETRTITQLIYKNWLPSRPTPSDPTEMLNFLENLESVRKQADYQPVLLQCLNGAERSGLIVVLVSILQQLKFNKEVSIPLVIRQLKSWRQQIIPNFEQFKFCYDVVLSHIESHTTYANM